MGDAKEKTGAETLVLAMPSAGGEQIRAVIEAAAEHGLTVRTVPSLNELFEGRVDPSSIRAVTEADLLGRRQIDTDLGAIAGYLTGKRVLVTGAGGSIGSELCRQLSTFEPAELMMLDRDESALHALQLSMEGTALLESEDLIVADIRDAERLHEIFERRRPEVVFHAAALKHLPLLELHPEEGVKSNVWGTRNVLDASVRVRRGAVREHLHRQGRQPDQCAGLHEAGCRAVHRAHGGRDRPCHTSRSASATCSAAVDRSCRRSRP